MNLEKWFLRNVKGNLDEISRKLNISKILSKLLLNRGIMDYNTMNRFINPTLDKLHDPKLMKDIELGVEILKDSIMNKEKIRICGDYDQDGN